MSSIRYRVADDFAKKDPESAIADPKEFTPTKAHLNALADGIMIGVAYMLIQSGVKDQEGIAKYKGLNSILRALPSLLVKLGGKSQFFREEMMKMKQKGPSMYLDRISQKLRAL